MKRNKPGKPGQLGVSRKKRSGKMYRVPDWERGARLWHIAAPLDAIGNVKTLSMSNAVTSGKDGIEGNPFWHDGLCRWVIPFGSKSVVVYGGPHGFSSTFEKGVYRSAIPDHDKDFLTFSAHHKCPNGDDCPLAYYRCEDIDFTLRRHNPGTCPAGIQDENWKHVGRFTAKPKVDGSDYGYPIF